MISSGPRSGFLGSTFASVNGFTCALAHAYLNWSNVRVIARPRLSGLRSTGPADFKAASGSGRTPRNGPGSIVTEPADHRRGVVGDPLQRLPREHLGVGARFLDRLRVVRPGRRHTRVAVLLEQADPVVPAARQQPKPMDEDDRSPAARVGLIDLTLLAVGDLGHGAAPSVGGGPYESPSVS